MTRHVLNSVVPPWYLVDRFADHFERALGSDWTMHDIHVGNMEFRDEDGRKLPMTPRYRDVTINAGTIYATIREALRENVPRIWLHADVLIADS